MKVLLFLFAVVFSVRADAIYLQDEKWQEWEAWKLTFNKMYESDDENMNRFEVWSNNRDYVDQWNAEDNSFTLGMNEFADMTENEFGQKFLGLKTAKMQVKEKFCKKEHNRTASAVPDSVDWRTKGYVTQVKNQGACGSCWAFSATGSLEGQHFKKTGKLVSLSEQNLMDCSRKEGDDGCGGGLMDDAFEYVIKNGGIDTEASYPYKAKNGHCHYSPSNSGATCSECVDIKKDNEIDLQDAVAKIGPISVAMDAHLRSFMLYKDGIYFDKKCSSVQLDHGVLAVGYGSQGDGEDYWIVKNSWGLSWGMKGYFMLARNRDNACGVATAASYPVV